MKDRLALICLRAFAFCAFLAAWAVLHDIARAQTANWFNFTAGDTTCRASTVQTSPFRFSYYCGNPRGATAGSYTAVGSTTADTLTVGLSNSPGPGIIGSAGSVVCMFGINTTTSPIVMGNFGIIQPGSVSWECSGAQAGTTSGTGTLTIHKP